jgi:hypothetical protein
MKQFYVGQTVQCMDNTDVDYLLTLNKTYVILEINDNCLRIIDDTNVPFYYLAYRFIPKNGIDYLKLIEEIV